MEKVQFIIKMEISLLNVNGLMVKKRDMESIFLQMGLIILDYLKMTYQMEKVKYFIKMEILNMMEIGLMIKEKGLENII